MTQAGTAVSGMSELVATARALLDSNLYLTLATVDPDGGGGRLAVGHRYVDGHLVVGDSFVPSR